MAPHTRDGWRRLPIDVTRWRALEIAGLRIAVEAPASLPWDWPEGPLRRFASAPGGADVQVHVRVGRGEPPATETVTYDSEGGIFDVARDGGDWLVALRIRGRLQRLARFDADFREGVVVVDPDSFYARERHYPLAYPLDEVVFLHRLAREGGLLVHACGVERAGRARLFTGRSGAGKTTIARLMRAAGGRVLSDDRIAVRCTATGFQAWGTPWHGDAPLSCPDGAPLAAIHAIRHAPGLEARTLHGAEAAAALLANAFLPTYDRVAADRVLSLVEPLVRGVAIEDLGFARDPAVVPFVWERTAGRGPAPAAPR